MTVLEDVLSQEIIQKLGWTLLHFIWQAAVAALLLAILLRVLRKSTANLRYIIACMALGLIVLLPVITIQLVPVSAPHMATHIEPAPAPVVSPTEVTPVVEIAVLEEPVQPESVTLVSADSWKQRAVELLEPALPYIVSGWLFCVLGLSIWHLGGWTQLQRLKRRMVKQVDDALSSKLKVLAQRLRVKQTVQLLESALVQIPTVVGWLRPVILLPASALTGLSTEQLEALLAHELAHIRRCDYLLNILQTVVETLGFYHPAVWWVSHKIRVERENCCDDLAVSLSGDRIRYARALTSMEEIRARRSELAIAATGGNLSGRIRRLVGKDSTDSSRTSWIPSVVTILLIAIIVIPTTLALTAHDKTEHSAQFLLDKMLEHRSRVKNLQYIAESAGRDETDEFIKWMEDRIKKRREEGASERDIGFSKRSLERIKRWRKEHENRYETIKCTIDNEGRSKTELIRGDYDASGKKMPDDYKLIWAWNGIQSVKFYQKRGSLEATLEATIKDVPSASIHPWRLFISTLCQCLEETIEAKRDVSVEKLKDGTYRIAFDFTTKRRLVAVIDPSKGYTCALREDYNDQGKCTSRYTSTYEEVAEGIWFPVSGQLETFSSDSRNYKRSFKSSQIRINGPAFNASYFDVDMPKGTTVTDEVRGKRYVVGSKRVHDLDEPQKPSSETETVDPNSWQEKFYSIYSLEDGEVLKQIAPPFIPERRNYFKFAQPGYYSPNTPYHLATRYVFNWDGKLSRRGDRMGGGIPRLKSILESVIGIGNREYDIPPEILSADMSGDWIVRKGTPQEELLQALEQIIKEETGRDIDFVKQKVETEVIVARGKYRLTPLPNTKEKDCVHVYTDKMDDFSGAGGGSGTVSKFLRFVGNRVEMIIIDRTDSGDVELSWRNHWSANLSTLRYNEQLHNEKVDMLLNNLTRQTGLTFERKTAPVEKWFIAEQESSAESFPVPVLVKSPAPSAEDKAHVQIDCLIVEVSLDSKMDRETTIIAENLLGNKISLRDTKADVSLRKAAKATAAIKDKSAENKRVTQDQFKALVDMLTSKGYLRILMNPRIQVVDGKTAKIISTQKISSTQESIEDSIQITPHVFADGHIILQVEATISSKSIPKGVEQIPTITTREVSTLVTTSPGESLMIIGGLKETEKSTETDRNVKGPKEKSKEVLFILTPTIISPSTDSQEKADTQIEVKKVLSAQKLKQLGLAVIMYADDYDNKLPDTLEALKPYIAKEQDYQWILDNVEYLSKGTTVTVHGYKPRTPVAYDKTQIDKQSGTNVVFLDGHVEFVQTDRLEKIRQQEKRQAVTAAQRRFKEQIETDRENRIAELMDRARAYLKDRRYEKALGQLQGLLALEPQDEEAMILKDILEDMIYFPKQTEKSEIPYAEELRYPKNWREIVAKRKIEEPVRMDSADKAVYKQLETIIVDLSELTPTTSFSDAIEVISNSVDPPLDIVVNWKDLLKNADIEPDTAINMDGLPAVLLDTGLESLLKAVVSGFTELNYIVDNGVIKIGTLKMLPSKMEYRVYDVSDLVGTTADANDLIHRITDTIEPDSWYDLSDTGEGTITAYPIQEPKKFAVLQTRKIHQKIQRFLEDMHPSHGDQEKTKAEQTVTEIFEIRYGDPAEIVKSLRMLISGQTGTDSSTSVIIGPSKQPVVLIPGPRRKWIIAKASAEDMKRIGEWIEKLDHEEPAPTSLEQIDQQTIKPHEMQKIRQDYIDNDPVVKALSENVANIEKELIVARQKFTRSHPEVRKKTVSLQILKKHLDERIKAAGKSFDDMMLPEPNLPLAPEVPLITNTFIDCDLVTVFQVIASMAGITIIPDETVVGLVTAELQNVPLETALDIVLAGTPYVVKKTPYYYLVVPAVEPPEITTRIESAKKLSNLGKALLEYANDYDDKYPDSLHHLTGYLNLTDYLNVEELTWILANVEYLAHGKMLADRPDTVLAYDKKLLAERKGTNVLFNDSHVEFVKPEKLKELGIISATAILIDTRLLSVSEDFLKDIGLDANSVSSSDAWLEHLVAKSAAEPNDETYSLIIDELHVSFLLKAVQAQQGAKMLARVTVLEGKEARIATQRAIHYISGYAEPNRPSDKPVPKLDKVELGTRIWLKPELTPDNQNIKLDFKMEIRQLLSYEERKYKGKYIYMIPRLDLVSTKMPCVIPDGKTLLIVGLKIIEQVESRSGAPLLSKLPVVGGLFKRRTITDIKDHKMLLILVKPIINPQQKASKILPGQEDAEEHIKHLGRLLEKKLNPPAEPK